MRPIYETDARNPEYKELVPLSRNLNRAAFIAAKAYYEWSDNILDWPEHCTWSSVREWVRVVQALHGEVATFDYPHDMGWNYVPRDHNDGPFKITVNGREFELSKTRILYDEVCQLAGYDPETYPSMTFRTQYPEQRAGMGGIVHRDESIDISHLTHFSCVHTGNA